MATETKPVQKPIDKQTLATIKEIKDNQVKTGQVVKK